MDACVRSNRCKRRENRKMKRLTDASPESSADRESHFPHPLLTGGRVTQRRALHYHLQERKEATAKIIITISTTHPSAGKREAQKFDSRSQSPLTLTLVSRAGKKGQKKESVQRLSVTDVLLISPGSRPHFPSPYDGGTENGGKRGDRMISGPWKHWL